MVCLHIFAHSFFAQDVTEQSHDTVCNHWKMAFPVVEDKPAVAQVESARMAATTASEDPFLWLEDVNDEKCLAWAKEIVCKSDSEHPVGPGTLFLFSLLRSRRIIFRKISQGVLTAIPEQVWFRACGACGL